SEGVGGEGHHRAASPAGAPSCSTPRDTLLIPRARAGAKAANGGTSTSGSRALTKQGPAIPRHLARACSTCSALLQSKAASPGNMVARPAPRRERRNTL